MSNPIKSSVKTEWLPVLLVIASFLIGAYFYRHFPAQVATHWNLRGQVNGYSSPFTAAFMLPLLMTVIYLLFLGLPFLDPRKEQYAGFANSYHRFKNFLVVFFFVIFLAVGLSGLGYPINVRTWMPLLVGTLFIVVGSILKEVKTNWFLGVRTPWTMSSETVWNKTHQLSGSVFTLAGLLIAATVLVSATAKLIFLAIAILLVVLGLPIYSYFLYANEKKGK